MMITFDTIWRLFTKEVMQKELVEISPEFHKHLNDYVCDCAQHISHAAGSNSVFAPQDLEFQQKRFKQITRVMHCLSVIRREKLKTFDTEKV
jgi:hypothetical protein